MDKIQETLDLLEAGFISFETAKERVIETLFEQYDRVNMLDEEAILEEAEAILNDFQRMEMQEGCPSFDDYSEDSMP